jgi:hypothetical protein
MTEADEKRLAEIRETLAGGGKVGWWIDDDLAFLLRLLDERVAEVERLRAERVRLRTALFEVIGMAKDSLRIAAYAARALDGGTPRSEAR